MRKELPQVRRRMVVIGFFVFFLSSLSLKLFAANTNTVSTSLNVIGFVFIGILMSWGRARINPKQMDERQREVRNQTYFQSYVIVCVILLSLPLLMTLVFLVSEETARSVVATLNNAFSRPVDFVGVLGILTPLVVFLPWALLAWLEPDPITDDIQLNLSGS